MRIVHAIPGRLRVKIPRLKGNDGFAEELGRRLKSVPGVVRVEANPVTGSILVLYSAGSTGLSELAPGMAEALHGSILPETRAQELEQLLKSGPNGSSPGRPFTERVTAALGTLDDGIGRVTGGNADLRTLVPLSLVLLALGRLATSGGKFVPTWFDLLVFSLGTFIALGLRDRAARQLL